MIFNAMYQIELRTTRLLLLNVTISHYFDCIDFIFFNVSAFLYDCRCTFANGLHLFILAVESIVRDDVTRFLHLVAIKNVGR